MKYIFGSLMISFGILFVGLILMRTMPFDPPEDMLMYVGIAWAVLAVLTYPLAKRLIR